MSQLTKLIVERSKGNYVLREIKNTSSKRVFVFLDPRPSALVTHLVGPRPQRYCKTKYNTII